jgi:ABC-type polysaccharide/polyol phosphate export permease
MNPAYPFVRALRDVFLGNRLPDAWVWAAMLLWVGLACWLGFAVVGKLRAEIRDVL